MLTKKYSPILLLAVSVGVQAQTCISTLQPKAPDNRYTLQADGAEIVDMQTGLVWQRCSLGQNWGGSTCVGSAGLYTWQEALQTALGHGSGWRLPNVKELLSLVNEVCVDPAINITLFPNTLSAFYWTSSPVAGSGGNTWGVHFGTGAINWIGNSSNTIYVRLVRDGS